MSTDINSITIIGNLTRDPELKTTPNGATLVNLSLAVNHVYVKDGEKTETAHFFDCVVWGKKAEVVEKYCKKGNRLAVSGRLEQQRWKDADDKPRSKVIINVQDFQFLTPKQADAPEGSAAQGEFY